ncbi:glycosyl hydrolase family 18 protein [Pseudomonas rubra]|uniref:chitinase n=1 Tax=Pseudomonas rubra TaxID=2942627 RepID=A0ABT5PC69_9PSED|nr:glycosyl hydrolase family 18 protein [Pseudomonas rubra]MDD1015897.1 glycosyl hydrolase family 18 protein [Pseudomonas rubra]MDD1040199.1 glycosyl hydrolase family 18 protein [Pseudomonas rubra]MDD1157925.1 glycosyl hydrolase family 18 protein [Pseudomonas rubra]
MQEQACNGLQFVFEKSKGVDTLYLYNAGKSPIKLKEVQVQTNVFVGTGKPANLTKDTKDWLENNGQACDNVENKEKINFLRSNVHVYNPGPEKPNKQPSSVALLYDNYFCAWGSLISEPKRGSVTRTERSGADYYLLSVTYPDSLIIGPYEQVELSYANSFYGLPLRSPIAGVQCLPKVFVVLDGQDGSSVARAMTAPTGMQEVPLVAVILDKGDGVRHVLDRSMAGKAKSADLPRRFVGYYANYFMYERNYFVSDIPIDHINCISYGMMSLQNDGSLCSSDDWADNFQIAALQFMKQLNPNLQVSLIVGGWPKSPPVYFNAVDSAADWETEGTPPVHCFCITWLAPKNQWNVRYIVPSKDTQSRLIDVAPGAYAYATEDPQGLFDDNADKRGLYAWLIQHGNKYQRQVITADNVNTEADALELMALLGKAFDVQKEIAPFSAQLRQISRNSTQRERLAKSAATAVHTLGFDGFEVDWEYPLRKDGEGYVNLLADLRKALVDKRLAIAAPAVPFSSDLSKRLSNEHWRGIGEQVDHVNVMSYDYHGSWSDKSWFNAPMNIPGANVEPLIDPSYCVTQTVNQYLELVANSCLTRRQLALGLAGYGRVVEVEGANDENKGLRCTVSKVDHGTMLYRDIFAAREAGGYIPAVESGGVKTPAIGWPGLTFVNELDPVARSPYAYTTASRSRSLLLTYDDPRSLREKVRYALQQQMGGVMIWDLADDLPTKHKDSLIAAVADELRQCHPTTTPAFNEHEDDHWLAAARAGEPVAALPVASQVLEYGSIPVSHTQDLGDLPIKALAALPCGAIAVTTANALRLLAPLPQGFETQRTLAIRAPGENVNEPLVLNDGRLLLRRCDGILLSLRLQDGRCQVESELAHGIRCVVRLGLNAVAALQGHSALIWTFDASGFQQIHTFAGPAQLTALVPLAGGQLLLVSKDGETFLWQAGDSSLQTLTGASSVAQPRMLRLLPDGCILACCDDVNLQLWQVQRKDGKVQGLRSTDLPWYGQVDRWLDIATLPNGGFALLSANRLVLWHGTNSVPGYEVIQQISLQGASAMTVLNDGNLVVAHDKYLLKLNFPGWPQVLDARSTPWQATDKDGRTVLHWLACRPQTSSLEQVLACGAPVDLLPGKTLLAEAMTAGQPKATALLLSAGAPLWQAQDANAHSSLLSAELLAELLPASLIAALPAQNRIARVKADFDLAQLPSDQHDLLTGYPLLTGRMAICLYLLEPILSRQLQNLLSNFVIDDDCLSDLRLECPAVVATVEPLHGQTYADEAALRHALAQLLPPPDPRAVDAIQTASRRVRPGLVGEGHYDQAIYQRSVVVLQQILTLALEQPLLALQHKQLMEQFATLAQPQPGDLLNVKADLSLKDLPFATTDFLTLYPGAGAQMAEQLQAWSPALATLVTQFVDSIAGSAQQKAADLRADAFDSAHQAIRQLLVATVYPAINPAQAGAFLDQHGTSPWTAKVDPLGQPLAWVNWAFDPPASNAFTRQQGPAAPQQAAGSSRETPGQGSGATLPVEPTSGSTSPDLGDHRTYIARVRAAGIAMAEKSKPGKDYFSEYVERNRAKVTSSHPLTDKIRYAKIEIDGSNKQINLRSNELDDLDRLDLIQSKYEFVVKKSGLPDRGITKEDYVEEWASQQKAEIERDKLTVDKRRKDVKRMEEQRTSEVNADPSVQALAARKASQKKLNTGLDNTREVLQGIQGISKFTRTLANRFISDSDDRATLNKVLDYVDLTISITIATIDTIKSISNAVQSIGGAMGVFGAVMSVVNLAASIYSMFNPQPDPYLEAAKAISEQITQVYENLNKRFDQVMEQLQNMNQSLSWQMSVFNHQVDARFDDLQRQLDDMSAQVTQKLDCLRDDLARGLRMTRHEIRASTQQVLASIVWSHDDLANRVELANQGFKADQRCWWRCARIPCACNKCATAWKAASVTNCWPAASTNHWPTCALTALKAMR